MRREGKTRLRVHRRWALAHAGEVMHLFWYLSGQSWGKSMCGRASFTEDKPTKDGFACTVCACCREIGIPGHPLPRGMM